MTHQAAIETIEIPQSIDWSLTLKHRAIQNVRNHESCSQSILAAFMEALNIKDPLVMRSAGALFGGMVSSLTCGVHTSAIMVLGLLLGRERLEDGFDGLIPVVLPAQELIKRLNQRIGGHSCRELTGIDFLDIEQAMLYRQSPEHEKCVQRIGVGAEILATLLQELSRKGELFRLGNSRVAA